MKKSLLLLLFLVTLSQVQATIRRVNNNPGVTLVSGLVFADFNAAHTAAANGDTIYLEPSDINYGSLLISKKITMIGPGYLLNKNPNTPFDKRSAKVSQITFSTNSANGSKLYGVEVRGTNGVLGDIFFNSVSGDMEIAHCLLNDLRGASSSLFNSIISDCFILGSIDNSSLSINNVIISNNIIWGSVESSSHDSIVRNNIIFGGANYIGQFYNNIIYQSGDPNFVFSTNNSVYNNVCVGCTGSPANNNFFTTAANTVFVVSEPRTLDDLEDDNFVLHASSPAKTKGVGGIDCGVFSGLRPYILSGIPPFPMITAFTQGAPSGGNIPITISIKRN
ncbi:hypothetical protein [Emticicia sp. BO119]|uniref:hypothetical protein n=1 Tax=Emticicia sp. BO119 TaxID=2757768 RepID=UPI0015F07CBA|nr:hypothetical protein [Emticicia sp. BO119]MBA4851550.1 hypothetical protein [Emticicia sp. BO119]